MPEFMEPLVNWLAGKLKNMEPPKGLDPWGEVRTSWTYVSAAWPPVAVMPRATDFDDESADVHQMHTLTIKFGVQAGDPDELTYHAMRYMRAIDDAVQLAPWPAMVRHVHIARHDYGPLFQKDAGWSKFPELHLNIETREMPIS